MRPPRPIWLNLPLTQKGRYSTGLGNGACTRRRRSCSWIAFRGAEPGMIPRDHCHRWESWQWRVRWALACPGDVGMSKINGLHGALCEKEGQLALYKLEDVRGHPKGQSVLMRAFHMGFQSPFPMLGTNYTSRQVLASMHFPIVQPCQPDHVHVRQSRAMREIQRVGFRILRLIHLPNLARRGTTHAKEL
ncbi:hypothetical protein TNCV_1448201 [Trichonephila clavipes]|nr:hypothetical protein TNCV_1448201 [Trichonephila clavipes]